MTLMESQKIEVKAGRPYPVFLGARLEDLGQYLHAELKDVEHILLISNPEVLAYHGERLKQGLQGFQIDTFYVPAGEKEKTLERLSQLTTAALRCNADRRTLALAFGGGVIGDLAGFFASVFMRGIRFLQVPTTLLAQVDSSIGGKVAVNHTAGKNILGAFYPPWAVWMDFSTLESLPWEETRNGLAETVKHAVIADQKLFSFLETKAEGLKEQNKNPQLWREMASASALVKINIVSRDEREQGERALLNLGHTFGHALEAELNYRLISHGQGVSVGLAAAAYLAKTRGLLTESEFERIKNLLQTYGLPLRIGEVTNQEQDIYSLLYRMQADKKNQSGQKILILPRGIGQAVIAGDCTDAEILAAWESVC